jgi:hypothetical protein
MANVRRVMSGDGMKYTSLMKDVADVRSSGQTIAIVNKKV